MIPFIIAMAVIAMYGAEYMTFQIAVLTFLGLIYTRVADAYREVYNDG